MERSKSNSDLSLAVSKNASNGIPRSQSTCFLSRNTKKAAKVLDSSTKNKTSKPIITTIPDVNGNGDGNDNSQHGRHAYIHKQVEQKSSNDDIKNKDSSKNKESINSTLKLQLNAISTGDKFLPTCLNHFAMNNISKQQKIKGEISFQLLNSLAYSLYSARSDNFNHTSVSSNGYSDSESSFLKPYQSYSFIDGLSEKQSVKKTFKTARCEKSKAKGQQNDACILPQIQCEPTNDMVTKLVDVSHHLPYLQ